MSSDGAWAARPAGATIERVVDATRAAGLVDDRDTAVVFHDLGLLEARLDELRAGFPAGTLHAVAIKANPLIEVLRVVVERGAGLEAASWEEVQLAVAAGCPPDRIVFDSPAKTIAELRAALELGIRVNADNFDELDRIIALRRPDSSSVVGLRINPMVGEGSIPTTSVAGGGSKFGERIDGALEGLVARAADHPWITGLHHHVGSQGISHATHTAAAAAMERFRDEVHAAIGRRQFDTVDIGGGVTATYVEEAATDPAAFFELLRGAAPGLLDDDTTIVTEFGRALHANCGWAVSEVEYVKRSADGEPVAVVHLGADLLLRPVYQPEFWRHRITPLGRPDAAPSGGWTVAGPLCFAGDIIGRGVDLDGVTAGDRVVLHDIGAYTVAMWSRHCSRGIPAIVGYRAGAADADIELTMLRHRETAADVVRFWSA